MKSVKRLAKMDRKSDDESMQSHERQGMYYQFLIERKIKNGIIRHIASNEDIVTYEFIPNNYDNKRRKLKEAIEPNSEMVLSTKEDSKGLPSDISSKSKPNDVQMTNLRNKSLEDKASLLSRSKDLGIPSKNQIRFNLNLDFNKPCLTYRKPSINKLKEGLDISPEMKKSVSGYSRGHHFSLLKSSKSLIPCNLKFRNQNCEQNEFNAQKGNKKCSDPQCSAKAKYFITYAPKGKLRIAGPNGKIKE